MFCAKFDTSLAPFPWTNISQRSMNSINYEFRSTNDYLKESKGCG